MPNFYFYTLPKILKDNNCDINYKQLGESKLISVKQI